MTTPARSMNAGTREVLELRTRTSPVSALSAVATLAWRALLKIKHVPFQLFDVTVTPIMFTLLFTYIFGGALAGSPREYIQYLLPGILVQTVVFITVYTGVGLNTDIQKGLYDRFRSLPIWQPAPIFGALAGDVLRYSMASVVILIVGLILGFRPQGGVTGVVLAMALVLVFAFALSWLWIIVGMLVRTAESVMTTRLCEHQPGHALDRQPVRVECLTECNAKLIVLRALFLVLRQEPLRFGQEALGALVGEAGNAPVIEQRQADGIPPIRRVEFRVILTTGRVANRAVHRLRGILEHLGCGRHGSTLCGYVPIAQRWSRTIAGGKSS